MPKIFAKTAYLENKFVDNVRITFDDLGWITGVQKNAKKADTDFVFGIVMPGVPNVHSHAFQRAMAGLAETATAGKSSFWTWRELMYKFLSKLGPDEMHIIASQLYMEMLKAGYTSVGEFHYVHHAEDGTDYEETATLSHAICWSALQTGISLTYLPVFYEFGGFEKQAPEGYQKRFITDFDQLMALRSDVSSTYVNEERIHIGFAYHSLRAIDPKWLKEAPLGPVHIHISEQLREVEDCQKKYQQRPVEFLFDQVEIDRNWSLIHATHLSKKEITKIAQSGAVVGLCPTTEANLGDGLFPLVDYVRGGGRFAIGSDSNISIQPVEELRWLDYGQRLVHQERALLSHQDETSMGACLYAQALENGAQSLGQPTGKIEKGCRADLIVLDAEHPILFGKTGTQILDSWVFSGNQNLVTDVIVHGKWQVKDGKHLQESVITPAYTQLLKDLLA